MDDCKLLRNLLIKYLTQLRDRHRSELTEKEEVDQFVLIDEKAETDKEITGHLFHLLLTMQYFAMKVKLTEEESNEIGNLFKVFSLTYSALLNSIEKKSTITITDVMGIVREYVTINYALCKRIGKIDPDVEAGMDKIINAESEEELKNAINSLDTISSVRNAAESLMK